MANILAVDDDEKIRDLLSTVLSRDAGYGWPRRLLAAREGQTMIVPPPLVPRFLYCYLRQLGGGHHPRRADPLRARRVMSALADPN